MSDDTVLFGDPTAVPAGLTIEALNELYERIWNEQYVVCGSAERPHVVHPNAEGWTACGNCFMPLKVETTADGRKRVVP